MFKIRKKDFFHFLGIFALSLTLVHCGDGVKDNEHKQRTAELTDREKLRQSFLPLVGTYLGRGSNEAMGKDPFPVQLEVFIGEQPDGVNEKGEMKLRPELRALYRRLDYRDDISSEKSLVGRYFISNSSLSFVTPAMMMPGSNNDYMEFTGIYRDNEIIGELKNYRGLIGMMKVKKDPSLTGE